MFYYLSLPFVSLLDFFDRGGPVIFILFLVAIIMITLLVERLIFFINDLKKLSAARVSEVQECPSDNKWIRNKIKLKNISILNSESSKNLLTIQGLIALCPLLGLLGTVTGMIEVFDIMAITGTGNARAGNKKTTQRRGGGKAFGPKFHLVSFKVNKKVKKVAKKSVLSKKLIDKKTNQNTKRETLRKP